MSILDYLLGGGSGADIAEEVSVPEVNPNYLYADEYHKGFGSTSPNYLYGDEYHKGMGGGEGLPTSGVEPYPGWTGAGTTGLINAIARYANSIGGVGGSLAGMLGKGLDFATSRGGMAGIAALLSMLDRQKASGGGTPMAYAGPRQMTRSVVPGRYGPIARYAAQGGLMQAYAQGGPVRMEDGGFVLTKRAVDGAGGPHGIAQLFPGSRMIRGPGTGTSDNIPATIHGPHGVTPAKVSNGEAYVPKHVVQQAGGSPAMYDAMHKLQRRA